MEINGENLISEVRNASANAYEYSQRNNKSLAMTTYEGEPEVAVFFDAIIIDQKIAKLIINSGSFSSTLDSNNFSFGEFLRNVTTIRKGKSVVDKSIDHLNKDYLVDDLSRRDSEIDYLKNLFHCFELLSSLIKKSRRIQRRRSGYFLEYCAFCWRLVNKNKILNFSESADFSAYYCLEHHPKKSDRNYHKARSALIAAIKTNPQLYEKYRSRKEKGDLNPRFFYAATANFAKKHKTKNLSSQVTGSRDWQDAIHYIINAANSHYPCASNAIAQIDLDSVYSWKQWFHAVINALDPTGHDSLSWDDANDNWNKDSNTTNAYSLNIGQDVLLNILHRYEAACNIKALPQPRGPKPGNVKKNKKLRVKVMKIAAQQKAIKGKINGAEIARELKVSRQRISMILKELNLR